MTTTRPHEIAAFIGFGMSGLAEFCSYVDESIKNKQYPNILIFEKNKNNFCTGLPYDIEATPVWNLNGPPADRFQIPTNGKTLKVWMDENRNVWEQKFGTNIDEKYPPRALVGHYLKDQYAFYKKKALENGIHVKEYNEEVKHLNVMDENNFNLVTDHRTVNVNFVGIAFGHLPHDSFQEFIGKPNFFDNPWDTHALKDIPKDADEVVVIGGHLTFVDVVKWLTLVHHFSGKITSVTRHPSLIIMRDNHCDFPEEPLKKLKDKFNTINSKLSLKDAYDLFWNTYQSTAKHPVANKLKTSDVLAYQLAKFEGASVDLATIPCGNIDEMHAFIEKFFISGCYNAMWNVLCKEGQEEFTKIYYSTIVSYLAGIPPSVARLLKHLYDNDRIQELPGIIQLSFNLEAQEYICTFNNGEEKRAQYVINGTGSGRDISKHLAKYPLLEGLIDAGIMTTTKFGGVITNEHNQIINAKGQAVPNIVAVGPSVKNVPSPEASFLVAATASHAMDAHYELRLRLSR